jgi:pimeloyl-ACP methyl ester carboxylesterase
VVRDCEILYPFEGEELNIYLRNCIPYLREGMEFNGVKEVVRELLMERSEWGFDWWSNSSKIPIYIYHGKKNQLIPIKLVRRFAKKIEHSHLIEAEDKGHFFWLNKNWWTDILSSLNKNYI